MVIGMFLQSISFYIPLHYFILPFQSNHGLRGRVRCGWRNHHHYYYFTPGVSAYGWAIRATLSVNPIVRYLSICLGREHTWIFHTTQVVQMFIVKFIQVLMSVYVDNIHLTVLHLWNWRWDWNSLTQRSVNNHFV